MYIVDNEETDVSKQITVLGVMNSLETALTDFAIHADNLPDLSATYEPADAAIVKSDEAETLSANWVNTANPWAIDEGGTGAATAANAASALGLGTEDSPTFTAVTAGAAEINGSVTLANDETIANSTDTQILFSADGGENLAMDLDTATDNEIAFSSPGGATDLNFGSLNMATTGTIQGAIKVVSDDDARSVSAAEAYGILFINTGTIDATLPSAVAGMCVCIYQGQGNTGAITIQPNTSDYLVIDGARGTAATDYASTGAAGDRICVVAADATDWIVTSKTGTFSE
jgi:hypothetical protein